MPDVGEIEVEEMSDDEIEQAASAAVDGTSDDEEVMGFAPRDS